VTSLYASGGLLLGLSGLLAASAGGGSGSPLILGTDAVDGPTSGGEGNNGCYIHLYITNPATFAAYGTLGTRHVMIGGVEVANYRYLQLAVNGSSGTEGPGANNIWDLAVQVGSLGGATIGTAIAVDIVNNSSVSISTNVKSGAFPLDLAGNQIQFTPVNGTIQFVSLSGTDQSFGSAPGSLGTITNPLRHVQSYNGSSQFAGSIWGPAGTGTTSNQVQPGTWTVMRAGEYGSDQSFNTSFCEFFRKSGIAPSSASISGSLVVTAYPGVAGANSPEIVTINTLAASAGGFNFCDTSDSALTTPWGTTGYSQYVTISNLLIHGPNGSFSTSGAAGCPVNWQVQAWGSRVVNCDLSWQPTSGTPTSGGMGGFATNGYRLCNYIHDIADPSGNLQNHGIYIGNSSSSNPLATGELHSVTMHNYMYRIRGGQGVMMRGSGQTETAPYCIVAYNWFQGPGKFGVLIGVNSDPLPRGRATVFANVIIGEAFTAAGTTGSQAAIAADNTSVAVANGVYFGFNSCFGIFNHYALFHSVDGSAAGSICMEGNIMRQAAGAGSPPFGSWFIYNTGGATLNLEGNCWFDATGKSSNPSDSTGLFVDPLLTSIASAPYNPYPNASSTVPNKRTPSLAPFTLPALDFYFQTRPQGSNTNWALGAVERTGG
jgi:hypothetical protein